MISIVLAEDQRLIAESLKTLVELSDPELKVVAIACNGEEACLMADQSLPQIVLMDLRMPVMDGIQAISVIKENHPDIPIIALTTFEDDELILGALRAGASGYLLKDISTQDLVSAIHNAVRGEMPVSPQVTSRLIRFATSSPENPRAQNLFVGGRAPHELLSCREREVLVLAANGRTTQEMADSLGLSRGTVKNYLSHIYDCLGLDTRTDLVWYALKVGLIDP